MKTKIQTLTLSALLITSANFAIAADDPVAALITPDSSISIGVGNINGEREQFGVYDNLRDNETLLLFDADVRLRDDATGTWTTINASNLGIDNRSLELAYERQGNWGMSLEYSEIPYISPYTVNSGITGLGTEFQSVPDEGFVPGSGANLNLAMERERINLEFYKYLRPDLKFTVSFKNEEKEGDRQWGRGGAAEFAVEPIDWNTQTLDASLSYVTKKLQLAGGYIGSWYENKNDLLTTTNGSNTYDLSLPLDSEAQQFFMNGSYKFTPTTTGTFRASYTKASVDEHLPTADIPGLAWDGIGPRPFPAAPTRLNGDINTTLLFFGLNSRPNDKFSWLANLRYHEADETTPPDLIVCRRCDDTNFGNDQIVNSTPLDYETLSGKLEGTYSLQNGYKVVAGIDIKNQDRTVPFGRDDDGDGEDDQRYVPFRADLDETTVRLQLRKSMSETVNGALTFSRSTRNGSTYSDAVHSEPGEGVGPESIDPINIADRDRDKVRASLFWSPTEQLNLSFNIESAKDDYSGHALGLRDGTARLYSLDVDYAVNQDWQLFSWYSHDQTKANQENHRFASGGYSEAEMFTALNDEGDSLGFGLEGEINAKIKVGANFEWTRTRSVYAQALFPSGDGTLYFDDTIGPPPDIKSTATKFDLFAEYVLNDAAELRFDIIYQRWETNDWTWEFSDGSDFIYGTTRDGTTIIADPYQSATFVGGRYVYKF